MKCRILVVSLLYLGFVLTVRSQEVPNCQVDDTKLNDSKLCVKLKFTDGKIDFIKEKESIVLTKIFSRRLKISEDEAKEILWANLRSLFDKLEKPYRLALTTDERIKDDKNQFVEGSEKVRISKDWLGYIEIFNKWADEKNRLRFDKILGLDAVVPPAGILSSFSEAHIINALIIYEDGNYDAENGVIRFNVADPIDNWKDPLQVAIDITSLRDDKKRAARLDRIAEILKPLSGRPRCLQCIENRLNSYYRRFGFSPIFAFDNRNSSPFHISIAESPRVANISWGTLEKTDENIDKILYSLLTDKAFRDFIKNRAAIIDGRNFEYQRDTGKTGPYLSVMRLQIQQLLVNQIGYTISFSQAQEPNDYNITIQKNSESAAAEPETETETTAEAVPAAADRPVTSDESTAQKTETTPEAVPAVANADGVVTPHNQEKQDDTEFTPDVKSSKTHKAKKVKDKKYYVGGGIEFLPGQGVRYFGLGQVSRFPLLPGALNGFSAKLGGFDNKAFGSLNYFADYIFFNKLHRRLSLQLTTTSDINADRILNEAITDERRNSGSARLEFEPFRDKSGSLLRFYLEGKRTTVSLQSPTVTTSKQNLTTLDLGAFYLFETSESENPLRVSFEPRIRWGLGLAADEDKFNKFSLIGKLHKVLPRRFETDFSGRVETASLKTPLYELPSFGGADVVRGFRRDEALGRRLWSLQNELWLPLPIGNEESTGLKTLLREKVKIAPFFDFGGIYKTVDSGSSFRSGTGLGLRLIYNPIIIKLDYAYGLDSDRRRGKFYFNITSNLPF